MALNSFLLQRAMNPKAVQSRFLNRDDWKGLARPRQSLLLQVGKPRGQRRDIPGSHEYFDIFSPPGVSAVINQTERLSSKEMKITAKWV